MSQGAHAGEGEELEVATRLLAAVGQAFFSVNVGVGAVLTYTAYLPRDVNLVQSAIAVALGDTLIALLAGLAIFPIVFTYGLNPSEGPGLIFVTLSTAFAAMPGGSRTTKGTSPDPCRKVVLPVPALPVRKIVRLVWRTMSSANRSSGFSLFIR